MRKVLILGAGMVVKPIAHYLLKNNFKVTIASRTKFKADNILKGFKNGEAISWTIDDEDLLIHLIATHDIIVSLLPYSYHVNIAKKCIAYHKDMLTTSYVSQEMKELDEDARKAGVIILNEIGVDPGYDHMTAMEIIDNVHDEGGKIDGFYSLCGALCAPEASNNPFRYKFSWAPKGVVLASNNDAKFLKNGKEIHVDTCDLFKNPLEVDFPNIEQMHVYPNRNSLSYIDLYGIPEVKTMFRGTFRYRNWCEALDLLKSLNLLDYEVLNLKNKTYAQITAQLNGFDENSLEEDIIKSFDLSDKNPGLIALRWLGVLDKKIIPLEKGSAFDFTSDLMMNKMMMDETERDMVIMQHIFNITKSNGKKETITANMIDFGNEKNSSIARTVALPAAIAVKLILHGDINNLGVQIPNKKSIYKPILKELKNFGIEMTKTFESKEY